MAIVAKGNGGERDLIPADTYPAVCTRLIDIGIQRGNQYGDKHQIIICWEIPSVTIDIEVDGIKQPMPRMVSNFYNLSIGAKSTLGKHLESWRGRPFTDEERAGFDLKAILGAPCMLQIVHNENAKGETREKVYHVMKLMQGIEAPKPATELIYLDWESNDFEKTLSKLPEWQVKLVKQATNYGSKDSSKPLDSQDGQSYFEEVELSDGDLPF